MWFSVALGVCVVLFFLSLDHIKKIKCHFKCVCVIHSLVCACTHIDEWYKRIDTHAFVQYLFNAMANDGKSKSHANHAPTCITNRNERNPFVLLFYLFTFAITIRFPSLFLSLSVCVCLYLWLEQTCWYEMQMCNRTLSLSQSESSLCAYHF